MNGLGVIVLAAGRGTRMRSKLPKVAHQVAGKAMVAHVVDAANGLEPDRIAVVVGYGTDDVKAALGDRQVVYVDQPDLLGTGDAVARCKDSFDGCTSIMVLNGDSPLITTDTVYQLVEAREMGPICYAYALVDDVGRFGTIERDPETNQTLSIIEAADREVMGGAGLINTGQYLFDALWLWENVVELPPSASGEIYLTDLVARAARQGHWLDSTEADLVDVLGVDDRVRLAEAEATARQRIIRRHQENGVTIVDPATTYIDADVEIAEDVTIMPNCYLQGATKVASGSRIGPGTLLRNSAVGPDCTVLSSVMEESKIGARVRVGPFAHLRMNADVGDDCELGNYAEVKNSTIGRGVKMHHFSCVLDADVGDGSNIAAGIITCNYDGVRKNRTVIGKNVFVGSDTMLVAPVTLGDGSATAAGSVVIRDVAPGERVAGVPARPMPPKQPE